MKLDVTPTLKGRDGKELMFGEPPNTKPLTIGLAIVTALDGGSSGEKLSGEEKVKRFALSCKVYGAALPVDLTVDEASMIKRLVNDAFPSPLVVAPIWQAIEDAAKAPADKGKRNSRSDQSAGLGAGESPNA